MTNIKKFESLTPEQLHQFLKDQFPNRPFEFELHCYNYNAETIQTENGTKEKLISIPFVAHIDFDDEKDLFDTDYVEFELLFPNQPTFNNDDEIDEYVDEIGLHLNKYGN